MLFDYNQRVQPRSTQGLFGQTMNPMPQIQSAGFPLPTLRPESPVNQQQRQPVQPQQPIQPRSIYPPMGSAGGNRFQQQGGPIMPFGMGGRGMM